MPDKPRSLKKNFVLAFVGNAVYQACQWGALILLAKLTNPEEVGRFALALAITTPITVLASLNLRPVQVSDINDRNTFGEFLSLRIITVVSAVVVITGVAALSGYPRQTAMVIAVVGFNQCVTITREVFQSFMQKHERLDQVAVSQIIAGVLSLAALGVAVYATGSLLVGVSAMFGARVASFLLWDQFSVRSIYAKVRGPGSGPLFRLAWSKRVLGSLALLALPAALMSVMTRLVTVLPQYLIEGVLGTEALGFFAALATLPVFGQMVVSAAGSAALPRMSRAFAQRRRGYVRVGLRLVAVGLAAGLFGVLIAVIGGKPLITALFTPEYAQYQDLFVWLMVYGAVSYTAACIGYGLLATRWFWAQPAMFVVVLAVVGVLCWLWVPEHGLIGAAMAMTAARVVQIPIAVALILVAYRIRPVAPAVGGAPADNG